MTHFFSPQKRYAGIRIVLLIGIAVCALVAPWWIAFSLSVCGIIFFQAYEMILGGILLDVLFAQSGLWGIHTEFLFTSILLLLIACTWMVSPRIRTAFSM